MKNPFVKLISESSVEDPEFASPKMPQTPEEIEDRLAQLEAWKSDINIRADNGEPEIDDDEQLEKIDAEILQLRGK